MNVRLLDLEDAVAEQLRELPYQAYLCSMYVIAGEIRRAYFEFLSVNGRTLSGRTLDAVKSALPSNSGSAALIGGLFREWAELWGDSAEDGPPGWVAVIATFHALAGELTGDEAPRAALAYVTDTAEKLPGAQQSADSGLVEIVLDEEVDEASPRVQMLRRFGQVAELAGMRTQHGLPCDPDEIRSAVYG